MYEEEMKKPDLKDLCDLERQLIDGLKCEMAHGLYSENVSIPQLRQVFDMLKDVVETKKNCMKAWYYDTVTEAMLNAGDRTRYDYDDPMGYDKWRYTSGEFAPKGHGKRTGYRPGIPPIYTGMVPLSQDDLYPEAMMGYPYDRIPSDELPRMDHDGSVGRSPHHSGRYGYSYDEYKDAKDKHDKSGMDSKARSHIGDMMTTTREIWKDADPALRKSLKDDLTAFVTKELTV